MTAPDTATSKRATLRALLQDASLILAPGVFDGISARLADAAGFPALYMTGYGATASMLGLPDAGLASYTEMESRARVIASLTATPLIADADTGYGGLLNVARTVQGYEAAGVCAIQLEDQVFPKKCGHMLGRNVISMDEMVQKVRVACDSRRDRNTLIIARTDARTTQGLDEALRRGEAYAHAGADVVFIESPESVAEMEAIGQLGKRLKVAMLANMVEGGRTPVLSADELTRIGYRIAIFPAIGFLSAAHAMQRGYAELKAHSSSDALKTPLLDFQAMSRLMGFDEVSAFDARWNPPQQ